MSAADDSNDDDDSGFHDGSSTKTMSLTSAVLDYPWENGRRYHAYKRGVYFCPNDEEELERMEAQHEATKTVMRKRLFQAPIESPQMILDLGTGSGIWAIEVGENYPGAEVIGLDLSPIQPVMVPPNTRFQVDDIEEDWTWKPDYFSLIHCRFMLSGSIADVPKLIEQAFRHCKPGGYFELHDLIFTIHSQDAAVPENVDKWCRLMREGIVTFGGRTFDLDFDKIAAMMGAAGFIDVITRRFRIPCGGWAKDPTLKKAGLQQQLAFQCGLQGLSLAIFTRGLRWQMDDLLAFLAEVAEDTKSSNHLYFPCVILYGRKPIEGD